MPYLSFDSEYCELRFGANLLGGRGEGSVLLSVLASMPPTALILVSGDGRTTIRRLPSRFPIRVDGEILGSASMELLDNSHLEVGEHRLIFNLSVETPAASGAREVTVGTAATAPGGAGRPSAERPIPDIDPNDVSPWLLREMRTGRTISVPRGGMLIGRSEDCHLVVPGRGVSRRHALLEPYATGFAVSDLSVAPSHATLMLKGETWYVADLRSRHGTFVNGYRVATERALAPGCTITVGHVTLVFRARRSLPAPEPEQPEGWVTRFVKFLRAS